jgi:hypothetical protein
VAYRRVPPDVGFSKEFPKVKAVSTKINMQNLGHH